MEIENSPTKEDVLAALKSGFKIFRMVVERSCMHNNDEYVLYVTEENNVEALQAFKKACGNWDQPHVVVYRPVYMQEVEAGLKLCGGSRFNLKEPSLTNCT